MSIATTPSTPTEASSLHQPADGAELELEHPDIKQSMIAALGRVVPSHLLDKALQEPKGPTTEMVDPPNGPTTRAVHLAFAGRPELKAAD